MERITPADAVIVPTQRITRPLNIIERQLAQNATYFALTVAFAQITSPSMTLASANQPRSTCELIIVD
jgi:hypothetical protein